MTPPLPMRFGTDGVRGLANVELTPELVLALGRAAAWVLGHDRFLVGRDTRRSGPLLEAALAAGLASEGATVERLGVLSTPGVAWLSATDGVPAAVLSASHNPAPDNGVKFFAAGGRKLSVEVEARLEAELATARAGAASEPRAGAAVGDIVDRPGDADRYVDALVASLEGRRLDGLSVVLDCANGAGSLVGPAALRRTGAEVHVLGAQPNGLNINDGVGSTATATLQRAVVERGADVGLALDGDADRVLAVDHTGGVVDGDHLIALCAIDLAGRDRLVDRTVVVTVMTNLGFRLAMVDHGIEVVETKVGDRHVLEALEAGGWSLGGEQSGHVIFPAMATTGDGVLTGLQVLDVVRRSGSPLAELAGAAMTRLPQVLRNVAVADDAPALVAALAEQIAKAEVALGGRGRVLVRPSGTEPLVRVMVEAPTPHEAEAVAIDLVAALEGHAGRLEADPVP